MRSPHTIFMNNMKQKNCILRCTAKESGLQIIISMRALPQIHSLPEGLGYVHIGQVLGRSELSALNIIVNLLIIRKKLSTKCTKCGMMFARCQTQHT